MSSLIWTDLPYHRSWLLHQASALFDFFEPESIDPRGGFFVLDDAGRPLPDQRRELHTATRLVHCFSIARLLGRPGAERLIDHGMDWLWNAHRDATNGGYRWDAGEGGDPARQAYGHAFVLLAASSAKVAGHPDADRLLADVTEIIRGRFWEETHGAVAEEFEPDWTPKSGYRGQNSNMHMTEALMAAFEATEDAEYLAMAERIATRVIAMTAAENGWRVLEHFDATWRHDPDYANGDIFRPFGTTPGHSLEWTRLLLQLWQLGEERLDWLPDAAEALFLRATTDAWDPRGGFVYTLDWEGAPRLRNRLWWPAAEGIAAAAFLNKLRPSAEHEVWYRKIWDFVAVDLIDRTSGGWHTQPQNDGTDPLFTGKPDLYHALQACLIPLLPATGSVTRGLISREL
jgi:sulfoquinovose isomerase